MNMSFINKIRKLICHRQYINPIVDENIYQNLEKAILAVRYQKAIF